MKPVLVSITPSRSRSAYTIQKPGANPGAYPYYGTAHHNKYPKDLYSLIGSSLAGIDTPKDDDKLTQP